MKHLRLCRYLDGETSLPRYGLVEGVEVTPLRRDLSLPNDDAPASLEAEAAAANAPRFQVESARLLAPVTPSKIVCVGRNYKEHAAELGNAMPTEPLLFLKPPSAIIGPEATIELPAVSERVEHEGELAVVIGRRARGLGDDEDPLSYVLGYTCLNDVTARDIQRRDVQFTRGKSFDTFCPVGPHLVTGLDPADLSVETRVNGETRQSGRTGQMAFSVAFLVRYISRVMTLEPFDLIATGTPAGVGPLRDGDVVEVEVEGVGALRNPVRAQARAV